MINFSMLLINNNRSKAYLQALIKNDFKPEKIILLNDESVVLPEHTENDKLISKDTHQKFIIRSKDLDLELDEKEHVLKTIEKNNIKYVLVDNLNINSEEVVKEVKNLPSKYIVYSGPGGTILKSKLLSQNKNFLHVHPGLLPNYRGSTTIYYSMFINSEVGASVIILEEGIDEGPILYEKNYKISEKNIDFDYALDPLVRAKTLVDFFKLGEIKLTYQTGQVNENTFYIVHPFIKHLSVLKHNK
tara:strand:- start:8083 stop:8817 length:735 start_codon:yes stop_codon:yes gene_type:complete